MPLFHFPRPRSFLHLVSLATATEFLLLTLAINKITGAYGILALFTGYHLNILQLSHYIYSLLVLALITYLSPAVRTRKDNTGTVLRVLSLAWIFVIDTIISSAYTALFGLGWFVLLAQHLGDEVKTPAAGVPGQGMMNDTAGFTDPSLTISHVEVAASPAPDAFAAQQATTYAYPGSPFTSAVLTAQGSIMSLSILIVLWVLRGYMCLVIFSFARSSLRTYVAASSAKSTMGFADASGDATMASNPFADDSSWKGKLGRFMTRFPTQRYWLGREEREDEWARQTSQRFEAGRTAGGLKINVPSGGLGERERRARSGTGPPAMKGAE